MKKTIKFFAFILATLMLVSFVPLAAFAEEIETGAENTETETMEDINSENDETTDNTFVDTYLPEGNENIQYEHISDGIFKITVYSPASDSIIDDSNSSLVPGQMEFTDPSQNVDTMAGGSSNSEIIFDDYGGPNLITDTYIDGSTPATNYGYATEATVSNNKILYIKHPTPEIPSHATIVEASLHIAFVYDNRLESVDVNAHRVNESWTETGLTWNVAREMTRLGLEQRPVSVTTIADPKATSLTAPKYTTIDITSAAQDWASGEFENYGIALKTSTSLQIKFKTKETTWNYRPYFVYIVQVPNPYSDGDYYVKNISTEKYASTGNEQTNPNSAVQLFNFSVSGEEEWEVDFGDDGYYTIKSVSNGKYIGVDPTNTSLVRQSNILNNYTKWSIIETESGNYKLKCKATETSGYVLSLPSSSSTDGTSLIMALYTEDQDFRDEWELYKIDYTYTLYHYYDYGYNKRFSDTTSTAEEKIESYHNAVAERLLQIFGVIVYFECDAEPFESSADECKKLLHGDDDYLDYIGFDEDCIHGSDSNSNIHLTPEAIKSANFAKSDILTPVLWTGYILSGNPGSVAFNKKTIVMTPLYTTTETSVDDIYVNKTEPNVIWNSIYSLLHEVGHTLGAFDHTICKEEDAPCSESNCDRCVHNLTEKRYCIMACKPRDNIEEFTNEELFCQDCLQIIRDHLAGHH